MNIKNACIPIILCAVLWSGFEVAAKHIGEQFNPIQITFSRIAVGGLLLLPMAIKELRKRHLTADRQMLTELFKISLIGQAFSLTSNQLALSFAPATAVSSIACCNPVFSAVFAWLFFREKVNIRTIVCLAVSLTGMIIIIAPWETEMSHLGVLFSILTPLSFSYSNVLCKKSCEKYGGVTVTSICFLFASLELAALSMISHIPVVAECLSGAGLGKFANIPFFTGYSWKTLPYVLYVFVGATGLGFCMFYIAIEKSSALHASLAFFLKPIIAPLLALLILGERAKMHTLIGGLFMITALSIFILPDIIKPQKKE